MKKIWMVILLCVTLGLASRWYYEESISVQTAQSEKESIFYEVEEDESTQKKDYIKWVEFHVTCEAMDKAYEYDLNTYTKEVHLDWVDLLAYLGAKYGGDFSKYKQKDMDKIAKKLLEGETTVGTAEIGNLIADYIK